MTLCDLGPLYAPTFRLEVTARRVLSGRGALLGNPALVPGRSGQSHGISLLLQDDQLLSLYNWTSLENFFPKTLRSLWSSKGHRRLHSLLEYKCYTGGMDEKRPELWDLPGFHLEKRQAKGIPGRATCRCRYRKYERAHQGQGMAKSVWLDHTLRIENGGKTRLERQVGIWKTSWRASELNTHLFSKRFKRVYRSTQYIRKKFKCRKYKGWKIIEDHKQLVVHIVYVKLVVKARAKIWLSFLDARAKREMWTLLCPYEKNLLLKRNRLLLE